jgi:small subunit ribosomal protein S4
MGQIKKFRKKYETPMHPWQKERIIEEKEYVLNYGFKNKKEIWKEIAKLKKARVQAKKIIANKSSEQALKEKEQLLTRLVKFGLLTKDSTIEDVLGLKAINFFERRLQTVIVRKGLARSVKQARQFIVHGHILIADQRVNSPSFMVSLADESKLSFDSHSTLSKEDHPERAVLTKKDKKVLEEIEKSKEISKKDETKVKKEKSSKKDEVKEEKSVKKEEKVPTADELAKKKEETPKKEEIKVEVLPEEKVKEESAKVAEASE